MIDGKTVLGLITARGGSKGVPRKNVRPLGGKPLIAWTILAAQSAPALDRLILSSDDAEIIDIARQWGCEAPFVRPAHLASDATDSLSVVRHALAAVGGGYDYLVLLQPTSPLRTGAHIEACLHLCLERDASTCVSVCEVDKTPYWMFRRDPESRLVPLLLASDMPSNRQQAPPVYVLNGAVFVARTSHLAAGGSFVAPDTVSFVMPKAASTDIDTEDDLAFLQMKVGPNPTE